MLSRIPSTRPVRVKTVPTAARRAPASGLPIRATVLAIVPMPRTARKGGLHGVTDRLADVRADDGGDAFTQPAGEGGQGVVQTFESLREIAAYGPGQEGQRVHGQLASLTGRDERGYRATRPAAATASA